MPEYAERFMVPCEHFMDAENGGPASCGATPTRAYLTGKKCQRHTPAALAGHLENRPDPALSLTGRREAAGLPPIAPPPMSASRVMDDRAVASGKRRSSPGRYREAQARTQGR